MEKKGVGIGIFAVLLFFILGAASSVVCSEAADDLQIPLHENGWSQTEITGPSTDFLFFQVPPSLGSVEETYLGESEDGQTKVSLAVYYIENDHRVREVQEKVRELVGFIMEGTGEDFIVGLEGGSGLIDPAVLRTFPDGGVKKKVIEDYMIKGELTGPECASVLDPVEAVYWGLEDPAIYEDCREALLACYREQGKLLEELKLAAESVTVLKQQIWPSTLRRLDIDYKKYREKQLSLEKFLKYLMSVVKKQKVQLSYYPALDAHLVQLNFEREFDEGYWRDLAEKFIWEFKNKVKSALDPKEMAEYDWQFQAYRQGIYKRIVFSSYLMRKTREYGLGAKGFEALEKELDRANRISLFREDDLDADLGKLVTDLKELLAKSENDQTLLAMSRNLEILGRMANFSVSGEELNSYRAQKEEFGSEHMLSFVKKHYPPGRFSWKMDAFEKFYDLAVRRDEVLFRNLVKAAGEKKLSRAILVTGKFHASGIRELLREAKIPYALILPGMPEKILDKVSRGILGGRVSFRQLVKGKDTLEAPLAMGYPGFRDDFYQAATEKMGLELLGKMKGSPYVKVEAALKQWEKAYAESEAPGKKGAEDGKYIQRLYDVLRKKMAA